MIKELLDILRGEDNDNNWSRTLLDNI
jgi:hypothetical protein